MIYRRIRHWHIANTRNSSVIHSRIVMVTSDVFFRLSSALMYCLFSLWFRRFMFCMLLHASRILACVLLHVSVVQPASQRSHAGEWMFTHGYSFWLGQFSLALAVTLGIWPENLLPFRKHIFKFFSNNFPHNCLP